ncbi:tetratricopeptide repeat protein [Sphingobacterium phlebotomi]|uniref:Tetratricopeptide repeat protein n=1 Tax=Sphingobacterium phlebotomi TaxID=2605433 RepID=A0A5D4H333_9SPHI|nr:tetratricopeptide repeat protein [Sphingobacterium phlebotomi]TYR34439.1 tetratricopeptide repeat protein [Sphingobacterium phlebotomi]
MSNKNVNQAEPKKSSGSFFQDNQKSITFIIGGIILLILLYLGYQRLYLAPRAEKAANQLYKAEEYAAIDSLQAKAIEGDGSFLGFKEIAEEYSNTKSANIANAYLGGLYLRQGNFQEAIKYLQKYSDTGSDILDPLVAGLIGDAYSESQDYKSAANQYKKAAQKSKNTYTTPLFLKKLGLVYEALEDFKNAEQTYQSIKSDYPNSPEANMIDGLIARVQAKQQ